MRNTGVVDSAVDDPMNDVLNDDPATGPMGDPLVALRRDPTHPLNARNPTGGAVNAPPPDGADAPDSGRNVRRHGARAIGAQAFGATAAGAVAVGALAIGFLAVRRLRVLDARLHSVEIDDLAVGSLRVGELIVTGAVRLPDDADSQGGRGGRSAVNRERRPG